MTIIFNKDLEELQRKIVVIDKSGNGHGLLQKEEVELIDRETERRRNEWFARLREACGKHKVNNGCTHAICEPQCI